MSFNPYFSENPFSFLHEKNSSKRSTRKQSIRHMKSSYVYQENISKCIDLKSHKAASILRKNYVGKLGEKWAFPSDHLPVGTLVEGFGVVSWNILNSHFLFWIERDVQGLAASQALIPLEKKKQGLSSREEEVLQILLNMLNRGMRLVALQECSYSFLKDLEQKLPTDYALIYKDDPSIRNQLAFLYDKRLFTLRVPPTYSFPYRHDPTREVLEVSLSNGIKTFHFINVHIPGDPSLSARYDLVKYVSTKEDLSNTVFLGDFNFTEWEMEEAFMRIDKHEAFAHRYPNYPTNIGPDLYAKCIDHIYTGKDLIVEPISPKQLSEKIDPHIALLTTPTKKPIHATLPKSSNIGPPCVDNP